MSLITKLFLSLFFISITNSSFAASNDYDLAKGNIAMIAPPGVNKDYFLFEFGFVNDKKIKKWDYDYNVYVTASLFQDWADQKDKLRAGALGFKAGVFLPTQPWVPLLFTFTLGYAKTALHKNPFLGKDSSSAAQKDMMLAEAGFMYRYKKYFVRPIYQISTVKYFNRNIIVMFGVNY